MMNKEFFFFSIKMIQIFANPIPKTHLHFIPPDPHEKGKATRDNCIEIYNNQDSK